MLLLLHVSVCLFVFVLFIFNEKKVFSFFFSFWIAHKTVFLYICLKLVYDDALYIICEMMSSNFHDITLWLLPLLGNFLTPIIRVCRVSIRCHKWMCDCFGCLCVCCFIIRFFNSIFHFAQIPETTATTKPKLSNKRIMKQQ